MTFDPLPTPTLELAVTSFMVCRAGELWERLAAMNRMSEMVGEVRIKVDWNGIDARQYDMSFVPWCPPGMDDASRE